MSPRSRKGGKAGGRQSSSRRPGPRRHRIDGASFWGEAAALPEPRNEVAISADPSAVARSLGPPPLAGHETIAEHYLAVVYDRAVMLAGALAAAAGLNGSEED